MSPHDQGILNIRQKRSIGFELDSKRDSGPKSSKKSSPFVDRRGLKIAGKNMSFGAQASLSLGTHIGSSFRSRKADNGSIKTSGRVFNNHQSPRSPPQALAEGQDKGI